MDEKILTVTGFTRLLKKSLEDNPGFNNIWIKGEISNLTYHSSGHIYFTMKDESAVISCVFFRYANKDLSFRLEEGMSILSLGSISVFEKRGSYQLIVSQVRLEGIGELQKRIDELKKKLLGEGIFDPNHKKKIPFLPKRIGVVTSPTGAAIRDIIKIAMRRFPNIEIILAPAMVQGSDAAVSIVKGIAQLNNHEWGVDVIICGRGGGSFEDLMPFNEEIVVRAFYNSRLPIISAVGHQIDHPLCDDAADYAAPTPSAAAEIAVPVKKDILDEINYLMVRALTAASSMIKERNSGINNILALRSFRNPREIINNRELLLSDMENRMISSLKDKISQNRNRLLVIPDLNKTISAAVRNKASSYNTILRVLEKLSPLGILERGYSIAKMRDGGIVKSISDINSGDLLNLQLYDGIANCMVNSTKREAPFGKKIDR
jgi:exodeoxyribonuclease VII large subunit